MVEWRGEAWSVRGGWRGPSARSDGGVDEGDGEHEWAAHCSIPQAAPSDGRFGAVDSSSPAVSSALSDRSNRSQLLVDLRVYAPVSQQFIHLMRTAQPRLARTPHRDCERLVCIVDTMTRYVDITSQCVRQCDVAI